MGYPSRTIVVVTSDVEPEWEEEVERWYREEHIPMLLAVPGYVSARRFVLQQGLEGSPKYMNRYEIESPKVRHAPAYKKAVSTPWTLRLRPHRASKLSVYQQVFPEDGLVMGPAARQLYPASGACLLHNRMDTAPEDEDDFNAWYDEEHIFALCRAPGVISARRFKAVEGGPAYLAEYELASPEVQTSEAWQRAIDTPWTAKARGYFRNRMRIVYLPL